MCVCRRARWCRRRDSNSHWLSLVAYNHAPSPDLDTSAGGARTCACAVGSGTRLRTRDTRSRASRVASYTIPDQVARRRAMGAPGESRTHDLAGKSRSLWPDGATEAWTSRARRDSVCVFVDAAPVCTRGWCGRDGEIRTRGLSAPNAARYQAALHPEGVTSRRGVGRAGGSGGGGGDGAPGEIRTRSLLLRKEMLCPLSYRRRNGCRADVVRKGRGSEDDVVGPGGLEPPASCMSSRRSYQLSYGPR